MPAAICTLLRDSLFIANANADHHAVGQHNTHLSSTPSVQLPAGLRKGVRVRWGMYDMQLRATANAYCDTAPHANGTVQWIAVRWHMSTVSTLHPGNDLPGTRLSTGNL